VSPKPETVAAMVADAWDDDYINVHAAATVADRLVAEAVNEWQIRSWLDELADILKIEVSLPDGRVLTGIEQPVTPADVLAFVRTGVAEAVNTERTRIQERVTQFRAVAEAEGRRSSDAGADFAARFFQGGEQALHEVLAFMADCVIAAGENPS
jgi:hypothetical protein